MMMPTTSVRTILVGAPSLAWSLLAQVVRGHPRFRLIAEFECPSALATAAPVPAADLLVVDAGASSTTGSHWEIPASPRGARVPILAVGSPRSLARCPGPTGPGIQGFVDAAQPWEILEEAMLEVAGGRPYFTAAFHRERAAAEPAAAVRALCAREAAILREVAGGATSRMIARRLGLSLRSVETYRYRIMKKLGVGSLAALLRYAYDHGVLPAPGWGQPGAGLPVAGEADITHGTHARNGFGPPAGWGPAPAPATGDPAGAREFALQSGPSPRPGAETAAVA